MMLAACMTFGMQPASAKDQDLKFYWNTAAPIAGKSCVQIYEGATPSWHDNYLCTDNNIGMSWHEAGAPGGKHCIQVKEGAGGGAWTDNYLCFPHNLNYRVTFSDKGRLRGWSCTPMVEHANDMPWRDNYICSQPKSGSTQSGLTRYTFRRDYWNKTAHGNAMLANSVKSDVGADIAFAALNDSLTLAASTATGAGPVSGYFIGEGVSAVTDQFRDKDAQLPRLAKFTNNAATFLQYDDGSWCRIANGAELDHIERDSLEPMERYDLAPNAAAEVCGSPDGFYQDGGGTLWRLYSSKPTNKAWYGIGFGDSYCAIPNPDMWLDLVNWDFRPNDPDWFDLRQSTKFMVPNINHVSRNRRNTGVCQSGDQAADTVDNSDVTRNKMRGILYNDHWETSGNGAGLYFRAKAGNPLGDVLTSKAAGFLAGTDSAEKAVAKVAGKKAGKALAFYGTATTIMSQFTSGRTTLPQLAKRSNSDAVYLQFDNGSWCFMRHAEMLSIMKADMIDVDVNNRIPSSVTPEQLKWCGWPDGFYKSDSADLVYYLYSGSSEDPTWYEIGFGDRYCKIPNEPEWRNLLERAGANRDAPQQSLHRISDTKFLDYRSEYACPTSLLNGVAASQAEKNGNTAKPAGPQDYVPDFALSSKNWRPLASETIQDVAIGWAISTDNDGNNNYQIKRLSASGKWEGGGSLGQAVRIGGTQSNPWALNVHGDLYRWNGKGWDMKGGTKAMDVGDGWAITTTKSGADYTIVRYNYQTNRWDTMPGLAVRIGGSYDAPWVSISNGNVFRWVNNNWQHVPGIQAMDIADGWALHQTETDPKGHGQAIYRYDDSKKTWERKNGGAGFIGGTYDDVVVTTISNKRAHGLK